MCMCWECGNGAGKDDLDECLRKVALSGDLRRHRVNCVAAWWKSTDESNSQQTPQRRSNK